jgi:hypothetical protein
MARRTTTPTTPRTPAEPGQVADADPAASPDSGPWPDALTLKGLWEITHIRERSKGDPTGGLRWAMARYGHDGVVQLDNHPALPIIRHCCRQLFGGQTFGNMLDALYDWLLTEKQMDKPTADALSLNDLAALLQQGTHELPRAARGRGPQIPPKHRTVPMSLRRAAKLMGYTVHRGKKDAVELLSRIIKDGSVKVERLNRQLYVFDRRDFPQESLAKITPGP